VKGTTRNQSFGDRLPIDVERERFNRLVRLRAPTFVIGVDVHSERSYIVSAHRVRAGRIASITKAYSLLDDSVKITLHKEVLAYWRTNRPILQRTELADV
jgi:hypothetical protein